MIATTTISMDLVNRGGTPVVRTVQNDKYSRNLTLRLYDDHAPWHVPDGVSVVARYRKPDGTCGEYDTMPDGAAAWSKSGNTVTVKLAPQALTVVGTVHFAVTLICGDAELSTFTVKIEVAALPGFDATSEDYFNRHDLLKTSGWSPNQYLATDGEGNVVAVDPPECDREGLLADSGWMPNQYLATDADGNVVAVDAPDVDVSVEVGIDEVLAAIPKGTNIAVVKTDATVTYTTTLDDGSQSVSVVTLDINGYPSKVVTDGVECPVSWEGMDDLALAAWEGGSY